MSFFDKPKKPVSGPTPSAVPSQTSSDMRKDPNLIQVFDKYGHEHYITKESWRTNVLPGLLQANWSNPDKLYSLIISALNDGHLADVAGAFQKG